MEDTPFHWIDNELSLRNELEVLVQELKVCPLLAVDLEYCDVKLDVEPSEVCGIIAIIQMSTIKSDYIIDCFHLREVLRKEHSPGSLHAIFADPLITKIMHGSDSD